MLVNLKQGNPPTHKLWPLPNIDINRIWDSFLAKCFRENVKAILTHGAISLCTYVPIYYIKYPDDIQNPSPRRPINLSAKSLCFPANIIPLMTPGDHFSLAVSIKTSDIKKYLWNDKKLFWSDEKTVVLSREKFPTEYMYTCNVDIHWKLLITCDWSLLISHVHFNVMQSDLIESHF